MQVSMTTNAPRIAKKILEDAERFKSGVADGHADFVNLMFSQIRSRYFMDVGQLSKNPFKNLPGANIKSKKGLLQYKKGKFVTREGLLIKAFSVLKFAKIGTGWIGRNDSPDMKVSLNSDGIEIQVSGRSARALRSDAYGSNRRRPIEKGASLISRNWKKFVQLGLRKQLRATS